MPFPTILFQNETVDIKVQASAGTFTVSYGGQTTSAQAYNVSAISLQNALTGLSSIGSGNVLVYLNNVTSTHNIYTLDFSLGTLSNQTIPLVTVNGSALTGTATVAHSTIPGKTTLTIGSEYYTSGAGPATAISGEAASTSADGLTVTLDGSPNLSGILTDGTHVIFIEDTTFQARCFSVITAVNNTAKTITVASAYTGSLSGKKWGIGGKRACLSYILSKRLTDRGSSLVGDALPGWTFQFASGHHEIGNVLYSRFVGTSTARLTFQAEPGFTHYPTFTVTTNTSNITMPSGSYHNLIGMRFRNITSSNLTGKTSSSTAITGFYLRAYASDCHADDPIAPVFRFAAPSLAGQGCIIEKCSMVGCSVGIYHAGTHIFDCYFKDCSIGIQDGSAQRYQGIVSRNIFYNCGVGLSITQANASVENNRYVMNNTFYGCTTAAIEFLGTATNNGAFHNFVIENNVMSAGAGVGILIDATVTSELLTAYGMIIRNNNFGVGATANTGGNISSHLSSYLTGKNNLNVSSGFPDVVNGNFTPGVNLIAMGNPLTNIPGTVTRNYMTIGAAQAQSGGGGTSGPVNFAY